VSPLADKWFSAILGEEVFLVRAEDSVAPIVPQEYVKQALADDRRKA